MADERYDLEELDKFPGIWILDSSFTKIDMIDDYISLIWANRYIEVGDFELYCEASDRNMSLLKHGNYVCREDYPEEVCRIEKIEIKTDPAEGNFITATGRDLRCILYQRCRQFKYTYSDTKVAQNIEMLIRTFVDENFINTSPYPEYESSKGWLWTINRYNSKAKYNNPNRAIPNFELGPLANIDARLYSVTLEPKNIGEIIADWAEQFLFGWKVVLERSSTSPVTYKLIFSLYEGKNRTSQVVFSETYNNLRDTIYEDDRTEYTNVVFSSDDINDTVSIGNVAGLNRYEGVINDDVIDSQSIPDYVTWENLIDMFGWADEGLIDFTLVANPSVTFGGNAITISIWFDGYDFPLYGDSDFEKQVKGAYPSGSEITDESGITYWHTNSRIYCSLGPTNLGFIAGQEGNTYFMLIYLDDEENSDYGLPSAPGGREWVPGLRVYLPKIIKDAMMQDNAYAQYLAGSRTVQFSGNLETFGQYRFRKDYGIGDKVRVVTDTGVDEDVRITEAVETFDSDGYNIEVGFEKE